jgi:phenylpyruvate tautomerase PptA (4-oxalocrotonate tautomerase family)
MRGTTVPDILVEVRGDWLGRQKAAFVEAIHGAVVNSLQSPPDDKVVRLIAHPAENFLIPDGMSEKFTHIEITLFRGRSLDIKRMVYREIVAALAAFGVPPDAIKIILIEVPRDNVGFRGGKAACDVDLGYETAV